MYLLCLFIAFSMQRRVKGVVVGWLPESGDDCALWQIHHLDGDIEDLELHEVRSI
jgi:hypothetical protein